MSRSIRRVRVVVAALTCGAVAGIGVLTTMGPAGGAAPTTEPATSLDATTTGVPAFADGEDARLAAEELIGAYIESEFGVQVADAACSVPASGEVGAEFACYGLKPGDLVIALRATIGPQRLVELNLLVDQPAPTTTTPDADSPTTAG